MKVLTSGSLHSSGLAHSKQAGTEIASTNARCSERMKLEDGRGGVISNSPSEEVTSERGSEGGKEQPQKDLAEESFRQRDKQGLEVRQARGAERRCVCWRPL